MATAYSSTTCCDDQIIEHAMRILQQRLCSPGVACTSPTAVRQFLACWFAQEDQREVFCALWLDTQNRLIAAENLFVGTLTQTAVYPREVLKRALHHNAASVIVAHNHPGGVAEPSKTDVALTAALKQALALIEVKLLDHFVIAGHEARSCTELGML